MPQMRDAFPYMKVRKFDIWTVLFVDMFFVDNDNLVILIADVSGKGITAALFMAQAKQIIQSQMIICGGDAIEAISAANLKLIENSNADMFVTVWLGVVNLVTGHMAFVDAGHNYSALQKDDGRVPDLEVKINERKKEAGR